MAVDVPRCQGLRVNTQKPCRITKHLNADGFCKLHAPDALQCRGTAKSTGARCRVKWDLNDDQLCQFHTAQASDAKLPKDARGSATTEPPVEREGGEDAKILKSVKKTTAAAAVATPASTTQCRGTAKSTGTRCRISKGLNDDGYCKYHKHQSPAPPMRARAASVDSATVDTAPETPSPLKAASQQCRGVAASTGTRCKISWELNDDQLCKYHTRQLPAFPAALVSARAATTVTAAVLRAPRMQAAATTCRGVAASTGRKCRIAWDLDANGYCKYHGAQHRHARL